ncbi:unnamed protein product [Vitrella brassicaformis CCMP3155]|uniref:Uncharacterized protein n=1 Tax=Vitrella brassicaformis (strain CCMP3155) TaxID=1169540 RepID=A0A0G4GQ17_VITBC|nr:unnamed protein product [Vitrella brassicaformis CCMP3155]|eukprot:CEM32302.1 unnamed protein product [Vitrella brassicaformis CCMP3155]
MVVWLFAVLLVPWAAVDGFVRPPLTPLQPQMPPTSRPFQLISRLRGLRCVAAMSGGPVGLLDGHFVYEGGEGDYKLEFNGQRLAIKPSFHSHIKLCIEPDKSAVGTEKGQEREEDDQQPPSPTTVALPDAATAATDKMADSEGDTSREVSFRLYPSGAYHRVVRPGSGPKPTPDQHVKTDQVVWADDFDGQDKLDEEVFTDMRVGEVRRVIVPAGLSVTGEPTLFGEYTLVAIL